MSDKAAIRRAGDCLCGRKLGKSDYRYVGGTFGYYTCPNCGREWEVDLNGTMWPANAAETADDEFEQRVVDQFDTYCASGLDEDRAFALISNLSESLYKTAHLRYDGTGAAMSADTRNDKAALTCECEGPLRNVTVDGNAGHSPGCPANPNTWPEGLRVCEGCGIPFSEPVTPEYALTVFPSLDEAAFVCEGCDGF